MGKSYSIHVQSKLYYEDLAEDQLSDMQRAENRAVKAWEARKEGMGYAPREILSYALNLLADDDGLNAPVSGKDVARLGDVISAVKHEFMQDVIEVLNEYQQELITQLQDISITNGGSIRFEDVEETIGNDMSNTVMSNLLSGISSRRNK